jgi:hypothetical protein
LKKCLIILLILFLFYIASDTPFCIYNAYYKYYFGYIWQPFPSTNFNVKSLTNHIKVGNYSYILSWPIFFDCNYFAKFVITFKLFNDFSSILPTELYIKYEESNNANNNIRLL